MLVFLGSVTLFFAKLFYGIYLYINAAALVVFVWGHIKMALSTSVVNLVAKGTNGIGCG